MPYVFQLHCFELQANTSDPDDFIVIKWAEEDVVSSFNLFQNGKGWLPFQTYSTGVRRADINKYRPDLSQEEVVYPAVSAVMTGQQMRHESFKTFIEGCCMVRLLREGLR